MSYTIIFETKFVKLSDGRLLHLDLSGCNNDNAGRSRDEFIGTIYTYEELQEKVKSYINNNDLTGWELKIGSKYCTFNDYAKHLARMANNAKSFEDFNNERYFYGVRYDGVELFEPEQKILTPKEFDKFWYDNYGKSLSYSRLTTRLKTEQDIITALDNNEPVSFYVGKKYKRKSA